jgi:hypothetical protein
VSVAEAVRTAAQDLSDPRSRPAAPRPPARARPVR